LSIRSPLLVTFSGLDGAGKSTQIESLREHLAAADLKIKQLAFWDDVVVGTRYREGFVHKVYGSEKGIGAPDKPVNRRDKNMRAWYLTCLRHTMYLLDAISLRFVIGKALRSGTDVVIVDRYIYDELVNLPLERSVTRSFVRLCAKLVPSPDIAYLLDADPEAARARKPEYPIDFLRQSRTSYHRLANLLSTMTLIPPLPLVEARAAVMTACDRAILTKELKMGSSENRTAGAPVT
jgi:thymidylate kinase